MYSNMNAKDFFKMLGANEKILNNPSFYEFLSDVGISNWNELRKEPVDKKENDQLKNSVTFSHPNRCEYDNYKITIGVNTVTGDIFTKLSFDEKSREEQNNFVQHSNTLHGDIVVKENGITTNMSSFVTTKIRKDGKEQKIHHKGEQLDKEYDFNGIEQVKSYATGFGVDGNHPNDVYNKNYLDEWTIIRREPIGYIAYVHSENKDKGEVNGFIGLDSRFLPSITPDGGRGWQTSSLMSDNYTPDVWPDTVKQEVLDKLDGNIREYFEKSFTYPFKQEYLEGLKIESLETSNNKTL